MPAGVCVCVCVCVRVTMHACTLSLLLTYLMYDKRRDAVLFRKGYLNNKRRNVFSVSIIIAMRMYTYVRTYISHKFKVDRSR